MTEPSTLDERGKKTIDVAATYIQVLIGLASGIIAAVLGFYPTLLKIPNFNFVTLKICLICFAISIAAGLLGMGGLITVTSKDVQYPPNHVKVRIPVMIQLIFFGIGIFLLITFVMPVA